MHIFTYESELWLPRSVTEIFPFFTAAGNLQAITPDWLHFEVLSPASAPIKAGALIDYRLRLHGFPLCWRTHISVWEPPHRFVDEQVRGPYRQWIHEHTFEEQNGGTLARDHVRYSVLGGAIINRLFVRSDVERIFAFRRKKLLEQFGG